MIKQYAEPVVAGMLLKKDSVLLTQSNKWRDKFSLPGGHIRQRETIFEAIRREMEEETGQEIVGAELVAVDQLVSSKEYWDADRNFLILILRCVPGEEREVKLNHESQRYAWVRLEGQSKLPITDWTLRALRSARVPALLSFPSRAS